MSDIDEDPDAPDTLWMTATGKSPSVRVSFATPAYAISGTQTLKAHVRRQSGGGTRTARIDLYEQGTLKATGQTQTITSTSGQTITQTFDVDSIQLADPSGAGIEARLVGGTTQGNKSVDLGALRWSASYVLSPQTLARFSYTLDAVGNPLQAVRTGTISSTHSFAYDANDRLTGRCASAAPCTSPSLSWTYDRVGNRLTEGLLTYTYDARDRLLEVASGGISPPPVSYAYDRNGNLVSANDGSRVVSFAYDLANRLTSVSAPPPCDPFVCLGPELPSSDASYAYDGDGKRVQAVDAGLTTRSLWDVSHALPQLALERDGQGSLLRRYLYGQGRLSQSGPSGTSYFHGDQLGSVSALTSAAGGHEQSFAYLPFGSLEAELRHAPSPPASVFRFTGEQLDASGLYHLRARQYDPGVGRFLTRDPAEQTVNEGVISAYAYVANRPTVMVDPSGKTFVPSDAGPSAALTATSLAAVLTGSEALECTRAQIIPPPAPYNSTKNYCSRPWWTTSPYEARWNPACYRHDVCYGSQLGRADCDSQFLSDMSLACKAYRWYNPNRYHCLYSARLWYWAARLFGEPNYRPRRSSNEP